jgi:hypothetical protein
MVNIKVKNSINSLFDNLANNSKKIIFLGVILFFGYSTSNARYLNGYLSLGAIGSVNFPNAYNNSFSEISLGKINKKYYNYSSFRVSTHYKEFNFGANLGFYRIGFEVRSKNKSIDRLLNSHLYDYFFLQMELSKKISKNSQFIVGIGFRKLFQIVGQYSLSISSYQQININNADDIKDDIFNYQPNFSVCYLINLKNKLNRFSLNIGIIGNMHKTRSYLLEGYNINGSVQKLSFSNTQFLNINAGIAMRIF